MAFTPTNPLDAPDWVDAKGLGTGTVFFNSVLAFPIAGITEGPWYVGNAEALYIATSANIAAWSFDVNQYQDQAATQLVQDTHYAKATTKMTYDVVPIMAPFIEIVATNNSGGASTMFLKAVTLAKLPPVNCIGTLSPNSNSRVLLAGTNLAVAGNAFITVQANFFIPGGAMLHMESTQVPMEGLVSPLTGLNNGAHQTGFTLTTNGGTSGTQRIMLDNDDWQVQIVNGTANAATVDISVMTER